MNGATFHGSAHGVSLHDGRLVTEASDLGMPVGYWPEFIVLAGDGENEFRFERGEFIRYGDEVAGLVYTTHTGVELHVLND